MKNQSISQISDMRKNLYYFGIGLSWFGYILCLILLIDTLITSVLALTNLQLLNSYHNPEFVSPAIIAGFVGFGMVAIGAFITKLSARGLAGSGFQFNPKQAKKNQEHKSKSVAVNATPSMMKMRATATNAALKYKT